MSNFHDNNTNYSNYNGYPNNSNIPNEPSGGGNRNGRHSNAVVIVSIALVMLILGGLLGGRGALVQGALGLLQGCIYAAQLGGDFGALPLQLVDLALGLALLVLQFFQFLLGFVVGPLGLILFCR